jgi:hypothetical protein
VRLKWQRLCAAAVLSLLAAGTATVHAQELRDRDRTLAAARRIADDLRKARMHYGPFYLLSSIELADIGYDREFFVPTADTTSGFSFGLAAPTRLYVTPNKKMYFSVEGTPQWSHFRSSNLNNQLDNQWGYRTRADAQFLLNHLYLDVYAIRNNELRADNGELSALLTRRNTEYGTAGEFKYSSRTSVTFSALDRKLRFPVEQDFYQPDANILQLDRNERSYRAAFVHKTFPLTSLLFAGEHSGYTFPNSTFKNSRRNYGGAGFLYNSGRSDLRFEAGVATLDFIQPNEKDFNGAVGNVSLNHRLTDRWGLTLAGGRDLNFSFWENNNYFIANRGSITTTAALTKRLSVNAGYVLMQNDYDVPTIGAKPTGLVVAKRRDRVSFPSVGWTYSSGNWFTGGFDVGYLSRTSNFPVYEAEGIRLILRLSINP